MAVNLTYDPSDDPEAIEAAEERDAASLEVGEKLAEEQDALLAGKYKDAEELEQAYIELQKKLGEKSEPDSKDSEEETQPVDKDSTDEDEINPFEDDPQADVVFKASEEFAENGEITPETAKAIEEMSGKEVMDAYTRINKMVAEGGYEDPGADPPAELGEEEVTAIQNAVGGEQAYANMIGWAQENFTDGEIQAYDNALESGNLSTINLALQALYYRYSDANGSEGEMIQGKAATAVDGFRSQAEVVRAMDDPRYENDPAYRQDVYQKLERSNINF
tara:strand:- start:462 stop:1292 length:831 start_codon:yes stop_codon:yes gene_type:complete